mmetsp:Transcript_73611/g.193116  ORF Transcript_73611/g.193116 Transcript_73611/m.193116 type:complete len:340 (+) Transcript_73611:736-1755(+)
MRLQLRLGLHGWLQRDWWREVHGHSLRRGSVGGIHVPLLKEGALGRLPLRPSGRLLRRLFLRRRLCPGRRLLLRDEVPRKVRERRRLRQLLVRQGRAQHKLRRVLDLGGDLAHQRLQAVQRADALLRLHRLQAVQRANAVLRLLPLRLEILLRQLLGVLERRRSHELLRLRGGAAAELRRGPGGPEGARLGGAGGQTAHAVQADGALGVGVGGAHLCSVVGVLADAALAARARQEVDADLRLHKVRARLQLLQAVSVGARVFVAAEAPGEVLAEPCLDQLALERPGRAALRQGRTCCLGQAGGQRQGGAHGHSDGVAGHRTGCSSKGGCQAGKLERFEA